MSLDEIELQFFTRVPIEKLISEVKELYESSPPDSDERGRAAFLIGNYYQELEQFRVSETAAGYFAEAQRIASKVRNARLLSDLLHVEAWGARLAGDLKKVNMLEQQALLLATQAGHPHGMAYSLDYLGRVAIHFGLREEGIEYLNRSLHLSQEYGMLKRQMRLFTYFSELYSKSHEYDTSRAHALEALRIAREISMYSEIPEYTLRLAGIELERNEYEVVTQLVADVRKTLPKEIHALWSGTHALTALVHKAQGRYPEAEVEFRIALSLADYPYAERERADLRVQLADLYVTMGEPARALEEGLAALADAERVGNADNRKAALSRIQTAYKELGDYKHAHEYLERSNALIAESDTKLLKSRLEYHALKNDFEVEHAKSETNAKESEVLRLQLEHKERELAEKVRHLLKQAEALREFRKDLHALLRRTPTNDPAAKEIRARLAAFPEQELNWQEFEQEFAEAHPDFLPRLEERFPDLTQMETRVAAMVQMDLKSSDIAQLFSVTERAVEFHRLNLRKKLKLKAGETLPKVLSSL